MNPVGPVTRKMVAEEAGVSVTIVSYVINDNRYVDKEKRRRVKEAIKKLGYRPNAIARSLKMKKSRHILFVADRLDNEHFGKLLYEMDGLLYDKGYFISLAHNRNNDEFVQHVISRHFDGVIISSTSIKEKYIRTLAAAGMPVVLMINKDYRNLPPGVGKVYPGLYEGARQCVAHLYETGRRQVIYIDRVSQQGSFSDDSDLRLKGYRDEMAVRGLAVGKNAIITGCRDEHEAAGKISAYIEDGWPIDAIFARNDKLAALAMHVLKEKGIVIPDKVSVIGFDNSSLSRFTHPPLTTMEIDRPGVARAAVQLLQAMLEGKPTVEESLKTTLIVRGST